ncbi:MAG: hypothetical protein K0S63_864 [Gammaproteobacteria bacterium]|jgi:ribosomal subunit interface protein|nr:hypothetical protein [Gammaproteobacteria bacterium]
MMPIQLTIRDIPTSPVLEEHIYKKAEKLKQYCHQINSCHVVIELAQKHKHQGKLFGVHIRLNVPGKELVVDDKKDEDVYIAVRNAFMALKRKLNNYAERRRGDVKHHTQLNKLAEPSVIQ